VVCAWPRPLLAVFADPGLLARAPNPQHARKFHAPRLGHAATDGRSDRLKRGITGDRDSHRGGAGDCKGSALNGRAGWDRFRRRSLEIDGKVSEALQLTSEVNPELRPDRLLKTLLGGAPARQGFR
jgi:hypothetical protein